MDRVYKPNISNYTWGNRADRLPPTEEHPRGRKICRYYHVNTCSSDTCHLDHEHCPRLLADGLHCFANHKAMDCPYD